MTASTSGVAPARSSLVARLRSDPSSVALLVLAAVTLVPFVVALVVLWTRPWWHPGGDEALISLRAWDVGRDTPLLGAYSRYGWNHPGPLLFWLLAVPVRLLGDAGTGATAGAIVINASAAVAVVVLAARRVGIVGAAGAMGLMAALIAANDHVIWSVWNPHVTLLAFLAYLVAVWCIADGDVAGWPVAAVSAVFCIQSHVGYGTVVAALGVVAVVLALVPWWRAGRPAPTRRSVVVVGGSFAAAALLMVPVLVDQVARTGNIGALLEWFADGDRATLGLADAVGLLSRQLLPWGPWAGGPEVVVPILGSTEAMSGWWLLVPIAALAATAALATARGDHTVLRLVGLVATAAVVALTAIAAVTPPAFPYLFVWVHVVAGALWATVLLGVVRAVAPWVVARWPAAARPGSRAWVGAVAVAGVVPMVLVALTLPGRALPESSTGRAVGALEEAALAAVPAGATFTIGSDNPYTRVVEGLGLVLIEEGRSVVVGPEHALAWGTFREGDPAVQADVRLGVVSGTELVVDGAPPGWVELARYDPLDAEEAAEREALRRRLMQQAEGVDRPDLVGLLNGGPWPLLAADGTGLDPTDVERYVQLARRGQPTALFLADDGAP
ncbi:hypothetical protein [Rhabdothermincola salaria]|uniref:hypothetical protein n=1 Tax=Rhabdothermincola salaria TaxID=2903142 RepID=UPI001E2B6D92|nr:hypothetical protein [Rhabdothermincola salaria]MCD9624358.1 hypothetical protein [Rhabdothermincola salaria]